MKRLRLALFLAIVAACAVAPTRAQAAWSHDPNFSTPVCTRTGSQSTVVSVPDGAGGAILIWSDLRSASGDIYAQRIDAQGRALWAADGVPISAATNTQQAPVACTDGAGGAIVAWWDQRSGTSVDLYAQRVNGSGAALWTANGVAVCTAASDQSYPSIAPDGAGGAVIAWQDFRNASHLDIYAQRITAAGASAWATNGVVVSNATGDQQRVTVAEDGTGGAYLAWTDARVSLGTADLYAQRLSGSGVPQWTANGISVSNESNFQTDARAIPDGQGGAIICWSDSRAATTNVDIYAQRFGPDGFAAWGADGRAVCNTTDYQSFPVPVSDGAGGAIFVWYDQRNGTLDLYAQRFHSGGGALWTANGVPVCTATGAQFDPVLASDGVGGAIVAWWDDRSVTSHDIYAQRIGSNGAAQWPTNGVPICTAPQEQSFPSIVADGRGGAILAWTDRRSLATSYDVYAQRVDRFGPLGDPAATISSVRDVPDDQGGRVKVSWNASWLDADPTYGVLEYRLWRSVPQAFARADIARGITASADEAAATGSWLVLPLAGQDYAWELVGTQTAAILPSYSMVTATTSDSGAAGARRTAFMVEARAGTSVTSDRWYSSPDSGYSVDNLAPGAPTPFTAQFLGAQTALDWNANLEGDLAGYRLYRGTSVSFVPSEANRIASPVDTDYMDAAGAPYVYKLTAVDVHGNESPAATVIPAGTTGVDDVGHAFAFAAPQPNPATGPTALRFTLAEAGDASLVVYDASGRAVRTVARGAHAAGVHAATWDLRDASGARVAPGLYFARLSAGAQLATRKLIVAK